MTDYEKAVAAMETLKEAWPLAITIVLKNGDGWAFGKIWDTEQQIKSDVSAALIAAFIDTIADLNKQVREREEKGSMTHE